MSAAPPPPAPTAAAGSPAPPGASSAARIAGSPGTATSSAAPTSPPAPPEADPPGPGTATSTRPRSRTVEPGTISLMCPRHGVTPGAAPITATPEGPLAGRGPPHRTWGRRSPTAPRGTRGSPSSTRPTGQTLSDTALGPLVVLAQRPCPPHHATDSPSAPHRDSP